MITWTASLETGVRSIDADHKHLIEFINLVEAASQRQRASLNHDQNLLTGLKALLQAHFEREEDLMFGVDYPGVNTHLTAHATLQSDFDAKLSEGSEIGSTGCAVSFVATWLVDHMGSEDKRLAEFIQKKKAEKAEAARAKGAKGIKPTGRATQPAGRR